jgi:hypothetical protein
VGKAHHHLDQRHARLPLLCHRLELIDHPLPVSAWAALLWAKAPAVYRPPPLQSRPLPVPLPLEQRLQAYRARVRAGRQPTHPDDPVPPECGGFAGGSVEDYLKRMVGRRC